MALLQTFSFGYLNCIAAVKCAEPPQFKFYQEPDFSYVVDDKNDAFPHSHCCSGALPSIAYFYI